MNNLKMIQQTIVPILKRNGVEFAAIFGSRARAEEKKESDIDILIRFASPKSLLHNIALEQELSGALGIKVDLVSEKYLHPYIRSNVAKDLAVVYGQRQYI